MHTFIGTKIIKARPLNRGDHNKYRGWTIPANEDPDEPGYLVVYPDGYESWTPKPQFDEAYLPLGDMPDQPAWLVRLFGERAQLQDKLDKLTMFLLGGSEAILAMNVDELADLTMQHRAMLDYQKILNRRIERAITGSTNPKKG